MAGLLWAFRAAVGEIARHKERVISLQADRDVRIAEANSKIIRMPETVQITETNNPTYAPRLSGASALPAPDQPAIIDQRAHLPDVIDLGTILGKVQTSHLAYGVLPGGDLLTLPMAAGFHSLFHGDTRSGKSNSIDGLLVQLHHKAGRYPLRIVAGDFKRELAATWRRSPLITSIETDPQAIADVIDELVNGEDGILARYDCFGRAADRTGAIVRNLGEYRKATGDTSMGFVFLVVDELNAVLEAADKKSNLESSLKQALQTGAGAGVFILGGAQYLTSRTLGREGSRQFVTRAHFGQADSTALRMMFGATIDDQAKELLTGQPGRGLIRTVQQQHPTPFQALRCADDDILNVLQLTDHQPTMQQITPDEVATSATQQEPHNASATGATTCANSAFSLDFAEQVRRCKERGMSKTKTIELLTGIKPGGGSVAYKEVSVAYEAAIKQGNEKAVGEWVQS
jgi:DNA segregation ATPase FtsK/SpoIIIE-like protein